MYLYVRATWLLQFNDQALPYSIYILCDAYFKSVETIFILELKLTQTT